MDVPESGGRRAEVRKALLAGLACVVLTLAAATVILRLWRADRGVPLAYGHDSFSILMWTKTMLDNGWWLTNEYLGAPFQLEMHDYPTNPNLHFVILKALSLFSKRPGCLINVYYLASFPLVALAALAALRTMKISYGLAVVGAVLYAFLPYHLWRGESHLFLSTYYLVPLTVLVMVWVAWDRPFLVVRRPDTGRLALEFRSGRALASLCIWAALGFDFPYYPLFGCFFLALAGAAAAFGHGRTCPAWRAAALVAVCTACFAANMSPNFLYRYREGPNPAPDHVAQRPWSDGEMLALKPVQLLLPAPEHPIPALKRLRDKYYAGTALVSEGDAMALGTVGSVGLLALIVCLLRRRGGSERGRLYDLLALLAVFGILLGTVGGFGSMFNLLSVGVARAYNRLSIFIGFFAVAGAFCLLDDLQRRWASGPVSRLCARALLPALLVLGLADQTGQTYIAPFPRVKAEFDSDADFVARVEAAVPEGSMVFQLPYIAFFSYTNAYHHMEPYSHFRGYLHSHKLRWSFGAMHGRHGDDVHAGLAALPLEECVEALAYLDFGGIYVDRFGYPDNGRELEGELRRLLGAGPIVSRNGRLSFFPLGPYVARLKGGHSDEEWALLREQALKPNKVEYKGFFPEERTLAGRVRWCGGTEGEMVIANPSDEVRQVRLRFNARTAGPTPARLRVWGPSLSDTIPVNGDGTEYTRVIAVPPGHQVVHFACTAKPRTFPTRTVVFALIDSRLSSDTR